MDRFGDLYRIMELVRESRTGWPDAEGRAKRAWKVCG